MDQNRNGNHVMAKGKEGDKLRDGLMILRLLEGQFGPEKRITARMETAGSDVTSSDHTLITKTQDSMS